MVPSCHHCLTSLYHNPESFNLTSWASYLYTLFTNIMKIRWLNAVKYFIQIFLKLHSKVLAVTVTRRMIASSWVVYIGAVVGSLKVSCLHPYLLLRYCRGLFDKKKKRKKAWFSVPGYTKMYELSRQSCAVFIETPNSSWTSVETVILYKKMGAKTNFTIRSFNINGTKDRRFFRTKIRKF